MAREKALVIVDDKGTRSAIKILLELNEIDVLSTDNGEEALKKIASGSFDVVLCDCLTALPEGSNILATLKESPIHYKTPVVILTDNTNEKDHRTAMNLGADDVITTPFQGKALMSTIKARLELSNKYKAIHNNEVQTEVFALLNKNLTQEMLTPLYGMLNVTSLISSLPGAEEIDSLHDLLSVIYESGFRMQRTLQNLRVYALLKTEEAAEVHKVNNNLFLKDVLKTVMTHYENDLAPGIAKIDQEILQIGTWTGQDELLKIIFTELIDNAIKFSSNGELPRLKLQAVNDSFVLSVTNFTTDRINFGIEDIKPFKKHHKDLSRNGLGLGLFVVRNICDKMGFHFSMSKDGGYVTFTVEQE